MHRTLKSRAAAAGMSLSDYLLIDLAVAYTAGIIRNHPFMDDNKRTGFLVGVLFLGVNGFRFTATEEDATRAILYLTAPHQCYSDATVIRLTSRTDGLDTPSPRAGFCLPNRIAAPRSTSIA